MPTLGVSQLVEARPKGSATPLLMDSPCVKSAKGHLDHLEATIREWTHRRDHGDAVPSKETLTEWIRQAETEKAGWERTLERAVLESREPPPLA